MTEGRNYGRTVALVNNSATDERLIKNSDKYKPMDYILTMTNDELKKWREVNGYSQARLAKALAVAVMTVSRWERGVRAIPPFLGLALRWLEVEGGELEAMGRKRKKTRKENKRHGKHL